MLLNNASLQTNVNMKLSEMKSYELNINNVNSYNNIKNQLHEHGFVKLLKFLDKEKVDKARLKLLQFLSANKKVDEQHGILLTGYKKLCEDETFHELFCNEKINQFFKNVVFSDSFGIKNIGDKGIRVIGKNEYTSLHTDGYRYSILSPHVMYNVWIPLNDIDDNNHAPLILCDKSHLLFNEQQQQNLNASDHNDSTVMKKNSEKWYTTSRLKIGDVIIFDSLTIHGSCPNRSNKYRLSCDYRYISKAYYDSKVRNYM